MGELPGGFASLSLAIGAGASIVLQQALNANLRAALGSAAWAGVVSYIGGTIAMLAVALALRDALPASDLAVRTSWWQWIGGLFGAIYVALAIVLVPRLGAATFIAALIAGQLLTSLAMDHYGLLGLPQHEVSPYRLLGVLFLMAGVALIRF